MNNPIITADRLGRRPAPRQAPLARAAKDGGLLKIAPVIVLVLALMMPPEVRINFAGQTIYAYRMAWLLLTPWVFMRLMRGEVNWRFNDLLVFLGSSWMTVSFVVIYGFGEGFTRGIALTLDVFMPYIIARLAITELNDFRRILVMLAPIFFLIGMILVVESIADRRFVRDAAASVFGSLGAVEFGAGNAPSIANDQRFGLLRAMGPFSHPILAGLFFSSLLPLYHFSQIKGWPKVTGLFSGASAILTFSSGAMVGIFLFLLLAVYDRLQRLVVFLNWPLFMVVTSAFLVVLQIISESGLVSILIKYTFNPVSGYYRLLIWEYGTISVERHPWFGIGFAKFEGLDWMGESIDAYWLAIAVRNGLPSALLLAAALLLAFAMLAKAAADNDGHDKATLIGLASATITLFVLGFTVTFFGGLLAWFAILLGVGTTLGRFSPQPVPRRLTQPRRPIA
jgi:O-antigen ligase